MPRSPDPAIFVLTTDTTDHFTPCTCARGNNDDDRQTDKPIALPLAHARGVINSGVNVLKSMEIQSGHSELSVISQVSAVEGCPLSGVPLYLCCDHSIIIGLGALKSWRFPYSPRNFTI